MSLILSWKQPAQIIREKLTETFQQPERKESYIAILFFWDNAWSATYVRMKQKFGMSVWMPVHVIGQWSQQQDYTAKEQVLEVITSLNKDDKCKGVLVQLPLSEWLEAYKAQILTQIAPHKDIDGLWWVAFGKAMTGLYDFLPATPMAVMNLLKYYQLDNLLWKKIVVVWQSNLTGKPLSYALIHHWATVFSCNKDTWSAVLQQLCQQSDYIISCSGHIHLINENHVRNDQSQILVDVWRWMKDGKAVGDIALDHIKDHVSAYTPVPGWVWPLTIASLFENIVKLTTAYQTL